MVQESRGVLRELPIIGEQVLAAHNNKHGIMIVFKTFYST
jgi:hypothetical protein